eukprot:jgi/Pico_ML_1/51183/g2261.t1
MARPDAELWREAITDELTSLAKNGTWRLVPLPPGRTPLTTTWVFKVKTDGDGQVERYKARLCVRGFEQRAGVDFHEVFAPTSGKVAQRAFLTYAALVNYEVQQVDIKTAFLNAELNEDIYLQIPEGLKGSMKTTEAEYQAASSAVKEGLWLKNLLTDLTSGAVKQQIKMFCDNQACIKIAQSSGSMVRTKHIDVAHHFVR